MKRTFKTEDLIALGLPDNAICELHTGMDSDCEVVDLIFRAEDKFWRIEVKRSSLAGWNSITGISYGTWARPEKPSFEATEVKEITRIITDWVDV